MSEQTSNRPDESEYTPYFEKYVALVPEGDIVEILSQQGEETLALLRSIDEAHAGYRYAPDKWSIKQVVGHINDTERIFAYRALRFARGDSTPLPGYEQDDYARNGDFDARTLADLAAEFASIRAATVALLRSLDADAMHRRGKANDNEVSVRALAHIIAGHELHHVQVLRTRYL
jgi:uncharacterized damage-inducible protein DinB